MLREYVGDVNLQLNFALPSGSPYPSHFPSDPFLGPEHFEQSPGPVDCVGLVRVSTEGQYDKKYGTYQQEHIIKKFVATHNAKLIRMEWPVIGNAKASMPWDTINILKKAGEAGHVVLVAELSRLSRRPIKDIIKLLKAHRVKVAVVSRGKVVDPADILSGRHSREQSKIRGEHHHIYKTDTDPNYNPGRPKKDACDSMIFDLRAKGRTIQDILVLVNKFAEEQGMGISISEKTIKRRLKENKAPSPTVSRGHKGHFDGRENTNVTRTESSSEDRKVSV